MYHFSINKLYHNGFWVGGGVQVVAEDPYYLSRLVDFLVEMEIAEDKDIYPEKSRKRASWNFIVNKKGLKKLEVLVKYLDVRMKLEEDANNSISKMLATF